MFTFITNNIAYIFIFSLVLTIGYMWWWYSKTKGLNEILDIKCDPKTYIKKYEKLLMKTKNVRFKGMCNYNIAVGHSALGQYKEALEILKYMEEWAQSNKTCKALYYSAIFTYYLNLDELEEATNIYDNYLKEIRKDVISRDIIFCIDMAVLGYIHRIKKIADSAVIHLEQIDYLYNIYSKKLKKRQKLSVLYNKAVLMQKIGDNEGAREKYKIIAEKGNLLWIAEISRNKLKEIDEKKQIETN